MKGLNINYNLKSINIYIYESESLWCRLTNTENRLYIGWFGVLENINKFQNPFHCPVATTVLALWLGIREILPIDKSLTLGLF